MKKLSLSIIIPILSFLIGATGTLAVANNTEFTDIDYNSWYGKKI